MSKDGKPGLRKVVPIAPYMDTLKEQPPEQFASSADLAIVQRWLNYADIALHDRRTETPQNNEEAA
ncbi:MAG TPA: hypothetical protein VKT29_01435 [Terriglobales bacterium]|nr:hypothetical protein [Terriglobales bacterium]